MSKFKFLAVAVATALIVVLAYFAWMHRAPGKVRIEEKSAMRERPTAAVIAPVSQPTQTRSADALGWAPSSAASTNDVVTGAPPETSRHDPLVKDSVAEARQQAVGKVLQRIQSMKATSRNDPTALAKEVEALKQANGGPIMGDIDLDILENNLQIAAKLQRLASDVKATASAQPGMASSAVQADMQQKLQEMRSLTEQIRSAAVGGSIQ
ncbi:hypothetical protein ACS0Y3_16905 [Burkholderia gladioli]|uniref:hypothetical protein n=1 Tax=Burkholderia gladioli TaxID=28095 RepID=UPI003F78F76A